MEGACQIHGSSLQNRVWVLTRVKQCFLQSHMKGLANIPLSCYDWFHNFVASGGIIKYQFNHLLFKLNKIGISPE